MPKHPIGKPVKIIPMGDVPAALEWVGYAKKRAWELLGMQGTWQRKVIHPNADTVIRIETLAGIPRVTITTRGGSEYILLTAGNTEYPYSLVGGPYKSGIAGLKLPNVYGADTTTSRHIQRMANDWYLLSARSYLGNTGNSFGFIAPNMQLATISSPWTYFDTGAGQTLMGDSTFRNAFISDSCYAGVNDENINVAHHLYMRNDQTSFPSSVVGPCVLTAVYDGSVPNGFTWSVSKLNPVFSGFEGEPVHAFSITYTGENRLIILGWVQKPNASAPHGHDFLHVRYTSFNDGASWSVYADASEDIRFLRSACYVGNGVTLGFSNYMSGYDLSLAAFFDQAVALNVWVSEDHGVSFNLRLRDTQMIGPVSGRPICIGLGACAYISTTVAGYGTEDVLYRTLDFGATWEVVPLAGIVSDVVFSSLSVISSGPPSETQANTTALMFVGLPLVTEERPTPGWSIIYSLDGGQTWTVGSKITAETEMFRGVDTRTKPEMYDSKLPPFPVFPDLHKNGLTVP